MSCFDDHDEVRRAIQEALPDWDVRGSTATLPAGFTYLPQSHALALDTDVTIVSGIRGAGKSHWYTYLADQETRTNLVAAYRNLRITPATDIRQGFGTGPGGATPSPDTFRRMSAIDIDAAWKCVLGCALRLPDPFPTAGEWTARVPWVRDHPEVFESMLGLLDDRLSSSNSLVLVLFDALDRVADDWKALRPVANRLFRLALEIRSYKSIRMKLFVRPDMLDDEAILAFPDASKLMARRLDLAWRRADLYALLFQRLGNTDSFGRALADFTRLEMGLEWTLAADGVSRLLPEKLRYEEELQSTLFHLIAGKVMAGGVSGHKRGIPYSWLVNHLIDSRQQVSPRSFFAALVEAARTAKDEAWGYALDPRSIQNGVVKASEIRKDEIAREDYPWVSRLMAPLGEKKLIIPCSESEIRKIWEECDVLGIILKTAVSRRLAIDFRSFCGSGPVVFR